MISYAQNFEDVILARVFRDRQAGFYVDIGAMDPVMHSVTKHFYDSGWRGINVEPNPQFHTKLTAERPRDRTLLCCVSDTTEEIQFHVFANEGISTLDSSVAEHFQKREFQHRTVLAQTRTLASILAEAPPDIEFLKVDVEGWETQVLRSNDWSRYRPIVILVEALDPRDWSPSWQPWEPVLTGNGYKFVYFDGLNRFYLREDQLHLETFFSVPPNLFDRFEPVALVDLRKEVEQLSSENQRLQSTHDTLQQALNSELARVEQLSHLAERTQQYQELQQELAGQQSVLEQELAIERATVHDLRRTLQALRQTNEKLQAEAQQLRHECLAQRLWAGQLAQEKAEAIMRLRKLSQENGSL